jgi:uncharacterized membrane protein (Fun14 family)
MSKLLALAVGGVFITVQTLAYNGYVSVNYEKLQKDVEGHLDLNHDGKIDQEDLKIAFDKAQSVLGYHMPTGGGFSAGLLLGLRAR